MKKSNFVIFAEPRTGSTLLKTILESQKQIHCSPELFNKRRPFRLRGKLSRNANYKTLLEFLGEDESKWFGKMNIDFKTYLEIFLKR